MKPILLSFLFLFIPKMIFSQVSTSKELILSPEDNFTYLDSTSSETKSKDYVYIRVVKDAKLKKENYVVQEYYRSGQLRMEAISKTYTGFSKEGEATYYYKNGTKKSVTNYIKGRANGNNLEWHENGNKKLISEYIEDEEKNTTQLKINQFWDKNGLQKVTDGNGFFENAEENGFEKGEIKNGSKEGVWEGSFKKLKFSYTETYKNGNFISGTITDENGVKSDYKVLEKKPEPKNGIKEFYQYIGKNFQTPQVQGLKGKIYVTFIVDKDGSLTDFRIARDIGYGTGAEAIRVLSHADNWIPGEQRGRKVRVKYSLPITIQN